MTPQDLCSLLSEPLLFLIPHQDDEILGCGGLIALLPDKDRLNFAFATVGTSFPQPLIAQQAFGQDPGHTLTPIYNQRSCEEYPVRLAWRNAVERRVSQ